MPEEPLIEPPFHLRGFIGPQNTGGWRAMKWHEDTLTAVFRDLDREPPEYILVRAPALGGKTTFAMQFMDRGAASRSDFFFAYLPLGGAPQDFLQQVRNSFVTRGVRLLDLMIETGGHHDPIRELSAAVTAWKAVEVGNLDLEELLRSLLHQLPECFSRVVLVLDDCDRLPEELRRQLGEEFRRVHALRPTGVLRRFSVLILARSLLRGPHAVSPLANVVKAYRLRDFTRADLDAFLRFEPEIADYLHRKTGGQTVLLQRILKVAAEGQPSSEVIGLVHVLGAVCKCFEEGGGVVDRLLDVTKLTKEGRAKLIEALKEIPVLAFEFDPAVAELVDLGTVKTGDHLRLVCRSPLIRELYISRFLVPDGLRHVAPSDKYLTTIPCVLAMCLSQHLLTSVRERLRKVEKIGYAAHSTPETVAVEVLRKSGYPLDIREVQYCYQRYYGDLLPRQIELDDVLRAVARVLVGRRDDDE